MLKWVEDITQFIFLEDEPLSSDIIFVPGNGHALPSELAAQLYHKGYAPYILPSGRYAIGTSGFAGQKSGARLYDGPFDTEWAFMRHILLENGVPDSAILCEDCAQNTDENARFSAEILRNLGLDIRRGILCCKSFHARRALMTYSQYLPGAELLAAPADTQNIRSKDWYREETSFRKVLGELERCGKYFSDSFDSLSSPR